MHYLGIRLKTERITEKIITKNDIIIMCNLLNGICEYSNVCEFIPDGITAGGILFKFNDNLDKKWYKSVRLCVNYRISGGKWYWANENAVNEWSGNNDIIFQTNTKITVFLKSFHGAPLFTFNELKIWDECFKQIGIERYIKI